ncbi:MAG: cytidylate kinase family protein [Patescibacteria group bacterium]
MIITLSGYPGSGKSTVAKLLAAQLGYTRYSMGDLRGKKAQEHSMTIDEWNAHGEQSQETDVPVDEYQRELGKKEDNFIIDGRLSWHFIPHSFKVFLDVDDTEGARRIFEHAKSGARKDEPHYTSPKDVQKWAHERTTSDNRRYQRYYGVAWDTPSNFDLVIDTTHTAPEEVAQQIIDKMVVKT